MSARPASGAGPARRHVLAGATALALALGVGAAAAPLPLRAAEKATPTLAQVFKRVGGAVVVVRTVEHEPGAGGPEEVERLGSGVLIDAQGRVVTAAHVVQAADAVEVEFPGGERVAARVSASDQPADVALLQLERVPAGVRPVRLGDSDRAEVGDPVFIVGAPLGISHTLTVGHVSARRARNATYGAMVSAELLQTDAAIHQGNSGGPMFNMDGEVIGVVSHIVSLSGGSEGLGFVVTSNMARELLLDAPSVWSGLEGYLLHGEMARAFNLPPPGVGLLVQRVAAGSPAERLGLRGGRFAATIGEERLVLGGDVVLAVEGIPLGEAKGEERIRRRLIEVRAGSGELRIDVLRRGAVVTLAGRLRG